MSSLLKTFAPSSLFVISSRVGVIGCVLLMHLFSDLRSRHTCRPPLGFPLNARAFAQSVGSVTGLIMSRSCIFLSSALISSSGWLAGIFSGWLDDRLGSFLECYV